VFPRSQAEATVASLRRKRTEDSTASLPVPSDPNADLLHTPRREAFAVIERHGHHEVPRESVASGAFRERHASQSNARPTLERRASATPAAVTRKVTTAVRKVRRSGWTDGMMLKMKPR